MNLRRLILVTLSLMLALPATARAQTNVRAWYAKGQTWVVWQTQSPLPLAYSVFRSTNVFTSTAGATFCGQVFDKEWGADTRLMLANSNAMWRVPLPGGGTYTLATNEGLFVYTPHSASNEFFAVVNYGTTSVSNGAITTNAVAQTYDPVNDPVQCHVQLSGTLPVSGSNYPYTVYTMWVDGRDDVNDARPDFPVLANAAKNGAPHMFAIYEPVGGPPATGTFPATLQLHGGGQDGTYWNWRPGFSKYVNTGHLPVGGITIAHDDRVYRAANGAVSEESPSYWFGWWSGMPAINPPAPPDNAVVVPYTARRLIWIQDWIETRSTYAGRVDPKCVSVMGTSMGGFGTHLLCRFKPERFSAGTAYVPVMGHPNNGAANKWMGTPAQNLPTTETGKNGAVLRVVDFCSPFVTLSPLRDRALTRFFRGRQEVDDTLTKYGWEDDDIPGQYRTLNDLGVGVHLYWDEREHSSYFWATEQTSPPGPDIGQWVNPLLVVPPAMYDPATRTERGDAAYQAKYRADQSYPGLFNDDQDAATAGRQPDVGNGPHTNGAAWGTWGGYYDWGTTNISDTTNSWACTMFLIGLSSHAVDNFPGTNATADVSVRKPQQFKPAQGTAFTWEWRAVSNNALVQSGNGTVGADDVVIVSGLQFAKDPARRRLTISTGASSNTPPTITSTPATVATVGVPYSYAITTTGTPAPTLSASGLPAWLTLSNSTLSGTPINAGTNGPITLIASNGVLPNATQTFSIAVVAPDSNSPSNVRAWSAAGQVFVVWQVGATDPLTYDVYRGATPFTDIAQATLAGRLFEPEWSGDRLRLANSSLTWRIPTNSTGGTYTLATNEGLFVFTPHAAASEYFAVVRNGSNAVSAVNRTPAAVSEGYDPVNDPVRCHLQFTGATTRNYPYSVYAMWADGRDNPADARPDFPIMANAAKNGAPHVFGIYQPVAGLPTNGTYPAVLCFHGGGSSGQWNIWQPLSGVTTNCGNGLTEGIAVAHDDRLFVVDSNGAAVDPNFATFWVGWSPTADPFNVVNLATNAAPVVPYTQRRVMWIQDWLEQRSPYRLDTERVSLMGTSMGGAGSSMLARRFPDRFACASCFVPPVYAAENQANARRIVGTQAMNLATTEPSPAGGVLRVNDLWNHGTRLSTTQRDVPLMRFYRGRSEFVSSPTVPEWSASTVIAAYNDLNATGWGHHLFWDQRDHTSSAWTTDDPNNPYYDIGQWVSPVRTDRPSRTSITRYRAHQSFPAFFNDDQNSALAGRQPSMGNGDPLDGDLWGTWSGYYDWDQNTITDSTNAWGCTVFLTGLSAVSVDNYPGTNATCDVALRRPQRFAPAPGASLAWRLRRLSDNAVLQSGATLAASNGLVTITNLTLFRDPARCRLEVAPAGAPFNPFITMTGVALDTATNAPAPGAVLLGLSGDAGQSFLLAASTNLADWLAIATNTFTNTPLLLRDAQSTNFSRRFYRALVP